MDRATAPAPGPAGARLRPWAVLLCGALLAVAGRAADNGAPPAAGRAFWSFQPLRAVRPPAVAGARNPVDAFWLSALQARNLRPAAEASRRVLLRRLAFDLTGLPPSPEAGDAFVSDPRPDAPERLAAALLASPRFGERWGRHWLDLARYADSAGFERDSDRPTVWRYRDWVVRAVNADLPYDQFVQWQLAGDHLAPGRTDARIATAFIGLGTEVETDTKLADELARYRYAELDDMLSTTAGAFLGLTVGCARCHDHKYDPIPTRDYYRLLCAFTPVERWPMPIEPAGGSNSPTAFAIRDAARPATNHLMRRGDPTQPAEVVQPGFLTALQRDWGPEQFLARADGHARTALARWLTDVDHGAGALLARVIVNRLWQHHFGEGLVRTPSDFGAQGTAPTHPELLEWLAGELVRNHWRLKSIHQLIVTSRCYRQADVDAASGAGAAISDAEDALLPRRRPVRAEAEALRDAMLVTAGRLNPAMGGPGVKPPVPPELHSAYNTSNPYPTNAVDDGATRRRSLYLFIKRSLRPPLIEAFDGADPAAACPRRINTTVAPQALALLNDGLVRNWAEAFADRLAAEARDDAGRVRRGFQLALSRAPSAQEQAAAQSFLQNQTKRRKPDGPAAGRLALADFCQALYCLNEFAYID